MANVINDKDKRNIERLRAIQGDMSFRTFCKLMGANEYYTSRYLNYGEYPPRTEKGRATADALGIVDEKLQRTRERNTALKKYALSKGYDNYHQIGTLILQGRDPIKNKSEL